MGSGFEAQLFAQAVCLEEIPGYAVPERGIYYDKPRDYWYRMKKEKLVASGFELSTLC
jgi:hypothetical protein